MLKNVQTLRFFAALWVVLHHMTPPVTPFNLSLVPEAISSLGFAGVDLFFVISGLIMAETTRMLQPGWRPATRFLVQRFGRIYIGWWPFFVVYLVAAVLLGVLRPQVSLLGSFFLWPQDLMLYLLPITWTLSFELYFYVIVAAIVFWQRRHATLILSVLGLLVICLNIWFYKNGMYLPENEAKAKQNLLIPFYLSPLVVEFIAGFLLAEWIHRRPRQLLLPWFLGALALLYTAYDLQINGNLNHSGMAGFFHACERAILLGGFSLCLVACGMELERRKITPGKLLQSLGDASYSIYLSHIMVLAAMGILYFKLQASLHMPSNAWALATLLVTLVFSWLSYRWMELPLHNIFKRQIAIRLAFLSNRTA
ncbi:MULTISPECIES: acyltransferase family protein [Delftia]|uniref:acyltransferase family protein n=1 Tax=Delftia TaxID=80865 RepID=UPI00064041FE|nr:acyltransferase [Delftia lacustris]